MTATQVWYRFTDHKVPIPFSLGLFGEEEDYRLKISLNRYWVAKETNCGVWLTSCRPAPNGWIPSWADKRFLNLSGRTHWAWPTIGDAWRSYGIRKRRQVGYLQSQLERAQRGLSQSNTDFSEIVKAHGIHLEEFDHP